MIFIARSALSCRAISFSTMDTGNNHSPEDKDSNHSGGNGANSCVEDDNWRLIQTRQL